MVRRQGKVVQVTLSVDAWLDCGWRGTRASPCELRLNAVQYTTTTVSLLVVILVSLESVLHYREQWKNYRSTEQYLGHELVYYETRAGAYRDIDGKQAFLRLVDRVESAIASENAATLNTMTLAQQVTEEQAKGGAS